MQHLLDHARSFPNQVARQRDHSDGPRLTSAVQAHVMDQLERLLDYPCIAPRVSDGRLNLHGWFYEVDTGTVLAHCAHADEFLPL